ncbi:MAG: isochorismatase family protein [Gemmatales bacterium]|nr:isochorismatase family protein [Gemmatales bacterium]
MADDDDPVGIDDDRLTEAELADGGGHGSDGVVIVAGVEAIEKTKRQTLLMAGILTSVCMAFPALSAVEAGYKVFCIIDASGNWYKMATDITIARIAQAGAVPIDTYAVLCELMNTWNRPDAMHFAQIMIDHIVPPYRALTESYDKAQNVQKVGRETKLERLEAAEAKK